MRLLLLALVLFSAFAQAQQSHVYVNGAGDKWYSAHELGQIAADYVKERKMQFALKGAKPVVWVNTNGSNVMASVSFASGVGSGIVIVDIDRQGKVITNRVGVARSHVGSPRYVEPGNTHLSRTDGPTNGSQPIRPETNRTSSAVGGGR